MTSRIDIIGQNGNDGLHYLTMDSLCENVRKWHHDRNLIDGATEVSQFVKLTEEFGEMAGHISRQQDITDDIGDMIVVLINLAERRGTNIHQCLDHAWQEIKDRKGKMINGFYIKEEDLKRESKRL